MISYFNSPTQIGARICVGARAGLAWQAVGRAGCKKRPLHQPRLVPFLVRSGFPVPVQVGIMRGSPKNQQLTFLLEGLAAIPFNASEF